MEYHKIQSIFKRDMDTHALIDGDYTMREFEYLKDACWEFTEKVDGTNVRVIVNENGIDFRGRTERTNLPPRLMEALNNIFGPIEDKFVEALGGKAILYGEGYGPKIQEGGKYREDPSFVLFDILWDGQWMSRTAVEGIGRGWALEVVPLIGVGTLEDGINMVRDGLKSRWGDFEAEGIVARPKVELRAANGNRVITKIKGKDLHDGIPNDSAQKET